ncbi:MAG: hypothetical protein ACTSRA_23285 [Promethearchaeota archaeon]
MIHSRINVNYNKYLILGMLLLMLVGFTFMLPIYALIFDKPETEEILKGVSYEFELEPNMKLTFSYYSNISMRVEITETEVKNPNNSNTSVFYETSRKIEESKPINWIFNISFTPDNYTSGDIDFYVRYTYKTVEGLTVSYVMIIVCGATGIIFIYLLSTKRTEKHPNGIKTVMEGAK